jgi:DNA-directed RNA polymerase subunit H (RpoH/RPB5)
MKITEKINRSRYTLKEILSFEWNTEEMPDYSIKEIDSIYSNNQVVEQYGFGFICNFKLTHKFIKKYSLHVIYYKFPDLTPDSTSDKVNKKRLLDNLNKLYEEEYFNSNDSVIVIINEPISETIQKAIDNYNIELQNDLEVNGLNKDILDEFKSNNIKLNREYNLKHFKNIQILDINSLTNNLLKHELVPRHEVIRNKEEIDKILDDCNANISQFPIILKNDIIAKLIRLSPGDICRITRNNNKSGINYFYRVCK